MAKWIAKMSIQKILGTFPFGAKANRLLQKRSGSDKLREDYFLRKWAHATILCEANSPSADQPGGVAMELGTGWFPVASLAFRNAGFERVLTFDLTEHATSTSVRDVLKMIVSSADQKKIDVDPSFLAEVHAQLDSSLERSAIEILNALGVEYKVGNVLDSNESGSIDLFTSLNTLEHIEESLLLEMFQKFKKMSSGSGRMSHWIDMSDHFAHFDKKITRYNFLRFSKFTWSLLCSPLNYQNRMRYPDYIRVASQAGWNNISTDNSIIHSRPELETVPIHADFKHFSTEELAVSRTVLRCGA